MGKGKASSHVLKGCPQITIQYNCIHLCEKKHCCRMPQLLWHILLKCLFSFFFLFVFLIDYKLQKLPISVAIKSRFLALPLLLAEKSKQVYVDRMLACCCKWISPALQWREMAVFSGFWFSPLYSKHYLPVGLHRLDIQIREYVFYLGSRGSSHQFKTDWKKNLEKILTQLYCGGSSRLKRLDNLNTYIQSWH